MEDHEALAFILANHPCTFSKIPDNLAWGFDSKGVYFVSLGYQVLEF